MQITLDIPDEMLEDMLGRTAVLDIEAATNQAIAGVTPRNPNCRLTTGVLLPSATCLLN